MPEDSCLIPENDRLFRHYHDSEWGVPIADDQIFFEKICLEGFQAGLSWQAILHKREDFRLAFDQFCAESIVKFTDEDVRALMRNKRIIRNERKIRSTINNARCFLELREKGQSLSGLCWSFEPPENKRTHVPSRQWLRTHTKSSESLALAKTLKKCGWSFVGPTNMYALMQSLGIVNDHVAGCPRRQHISRLRQQFKRP